MKVLHREIDHLLLRLRAQHLVEVLCVPQHLHHEPVFEWRNRNEPLAPDHYGTALKELVQEKMKGHTVVAKEAERPSGGNVVDLMEALKRSVGEGPGSGKGKSARGGKKRA